MLPKPIMCTYKEYADTSEGSIFFMNSLKTPHSSSYICMYTLKQNNNSFEYILKPISIACPTHCCFSKELLSPNALLSLKSWWLNGCGKMFRRKLVYEYDVLKWSEESIFHYTELHFDICVISFNHENARYTAQLGIWISKKSLKEDWEMLYTFSRKKLFFICCILEESFSQGLIMKKCNECIMYIQWTQAMNILIIQVFMKNSIIFIKLGPR